MAGLARSLPAVSAAALLLLAPAGLAARAGGDAAHPPDPAARVEVPREAAFDAPDGKPVRVAAGVYRLGLAGDGVLRLEPASGGPARRLAAERGDHEEPLTAPLAVSAPGAGDVRHLALLLPGGVLWEAVGREGGVSERGASRLRLPSSRVRELARVKLARVASASRFDAAAPGRAELRRVADVRFRELLADPTPAREAAFRAELDRAPGDLPQGDIMATLFYVFREAIEEQNEDKKYWLEKLKMYNRIGEALSDYIRELNDLSKQLGSTGGSGDGGGGDGGGCGAAADDAEGAADRLVAALAAPDARLSAAQRADFAALERAIARERTTLRAMRRLVEERSANSGTPPRRSDRVRPVRPPP